MIFDLLLEDYKHIFSILEEWGNENLEFFSLPSEPFSTYLR